MTTTAQIIDGKAIALAIQKDTKIRIKQLNKLFSMPPGLAVILVGDDPASIVYVRNKNHACKSVGMRSCPYHLPSDTTQKQLLNLIDELNQDPAIHGILVQLPLPPQINANVIFEYIHPKKDVDGFHPYNLGRLAQNRPELRPCTPWGIITLLNRSAIDICGMNATVVGASNIVGRPMMLELLIAGCTPTICHRTTRDLAEHVRNADLLIVAIGKPGVVKSEWIKPNAIVIDVGMNRLPSGKLIGDIDFETARNIAGWITPVPGGVGPMTVAMLLQNTVDTAELQMSP